MGRNPWDDWKSNKHIIRCSSSYEAEGAGSGSPFSGISDERELMTTNGGDGIAKYILEIVGGAGADSGGSESIGNGGESKPAGDDKKFKDWI